MRTFEKLNLKWLSPLAVVVLFSCHKENGTNSTQVDVYLAGGTQSIGPVLVAKYWKNGQATTLTDTNTTKSAGASSIVVVGSDVYVAGVDHNGSVDVAVYWKNGQA